MMMVYKQNDGVYTNSFPNSTLCHDCNFDIIVRKNLIKATNKYQRVLASIMLKETQKD